MDIKFDKPSSYSGLMQKSFDLYQSSLRGVFLLSLILSIIVFIPRMVSYYVGIDVFSEGAGYSSVQLWLVFIDLAAIVFLISIFYRLNCEIGHKHENYSEDLLVGVYRVLLVLAAAVVQTIVMVGVGLLIYQIQMFLYEYEIISTTSWWGSIGLAVFFSSMSLLILYIYTLFIFYLPIISVETRAVFRALLLSAKLVWNHWWRVFSLQITPWFAYVFALIFLRMIGLDIHIYFVEGNQSTVMALIANILLLTLYIPWAASLLLVQLKDQELRLKLENGKK